MCPMLRICIRSKQKLLNELNDGSSMAQNRCARLRYGRCLCERAHVFESSVQPVHPATVTSVTRCETTAVSEDSPHRVSIQTECAVLAASSPDRITRARRNR